MYQNCNTLDLLLICYERAANISFGASEDDICNFFLQLTDKKQN